MGHDPVLKLNQKPHTLFGIASFIMAGISFILIIITIIISASKNGMDESEMVIVGVLEWISVMFSVSGFGVAVIGEGTIDMERIFVHISLILNLIGVIYHGFIIYFGFIV